MQKVDKTTDLEAWLKANGLPMYDDMEGDAVVSIDQAVEFLRLFWKKEALKEYKAKIEGLYKDEKWYLLMFGTPSRYDFEESGLDDELK